MLKSKLKRLSILVFLTSALGSIWIFSKTSLENPTIDESQKALDQILEKNLGKDFEQKPMEQIYLAGPNQTVGCYST